MPCSNCANELPEGASFCPRCGASVEVKPKTTEAGQAIMAEQPLAETTSSAAAPELLEDSKAPRARSPFFFLQEGTPQELDAQISRKRRRKLVAAAAAVIVVLIAGLALWLWWTSPGQKITRSLNREDLNQAISIYQEELKDKKAPREQEALSAALDEKIFDYLEIYYRNAMSAEEARAVLNDIAALDFYLNPSKVTDALSKIDQREISRKAYADVLAQIADENYAAAMDSLAAVDEADPNYEQAQIQLAHAENSFVEQAIAKATALRLEKKITAALAQIDQALTVLPLSRELKDEKAALLKAEEEQILADLLQEANRKASEGAYLGAIDFLRADEKLAKNPAVIAAIEIFGKQYVTRALRWADEEVGRGDYDAAIETLENAKWHWYDESLQVKLQQVIAARPSRLIDFSGEPSALYSSGSFEVKSSNDEAFSSGNMAKFSATQSLTGQQLAFASFTLNGNYARFAGKIIIPNGTSALASMSVVISNQDGAIIYASPTLSSKTGALDFSVDVSGVETLTIKQNILDILPFEHSLFVYEGIFYKQ